MNSVTFGYEDLHLDPTPHYIEADDQQKITNFDSPFEYTRILPNHSLIALYFEILGLKLVNL